MSIKSRNTPNLRTIQESRPWEYGTPIFLVCKIDYGDTTSTGRDGRYECELDDLFLMYMSASPCRKESISYLNIRIYKPLALACFFLFPLDD